MVKRKLLCWMLIIAMATTVFTGCGSDKKGASDNSAEGTSTELGESENSENHVDGYPKEIDMEEEPYTVAIQVVTLPGTDYSTLEADMEAAINEITQPAINCMVDIQFVWISEIANTTSLGVAGGEKLDLIHVATVTPLSSMVGEEILLDMNEGNLLQNRGQDLIELFGDLMESGEVSGQQLAVPAKTYNAVAKGFSYNKTIVDQCGISIPEKGTIEDMETMLYGIKEAGVDIMPFYVGSGGNNLMYWLYGCSGFGTEYSYGVIFDEMNDLTIENMYASEEFEDFCLRMFRWRQDGILQKDSTDTTSGTDYMYAQQLASSFADISPYLKANYNAMAKNSGFELGWCEIVEPQVINGSVTEYMWGIASNSERPDKAMDFLNYMYVNEDVANILLYGLEGENYTFVEGSERVITTNGTYSSQFFYGGDESKTLVQDPADENYNEEWEAFQGAAPVSALVGYIFDDSNYQTEASTINTAITKYLPTLQNGLCESEEATKAFIAEFITELENAGINDVIAANQEQLDAFIANK